MYTKTLLLSALTLLGVSASNVKDLTPDNFDATVFTGTPALVEFFAPWCGHCKTLAPKYEELADTLTHASSKVVIAKVDGDEHKSLSSKYGISGFPTLKWFDGTSETPEDYKGAREVEALQEFIASKTGAKPKKKAAAPSDLTHLTDQNFNKAVGGEKDVFVAFTAPWCGHCKTLAPIWETLATDFATESSVLIAKVDAEANPSVAASFGVQGYPTLKFFPKGSTEPVDYSGGRDEKSMIAFVNEQSGTHRAVGGGLDFTAGTIDALDSIISGISGGSASLESVSADVAAAAAGVSGTYKEYYGKVLTKLAANQGYVEKELKRLEGLLKKGGLARSKQDDFMSRLNILKKFVPGLKEEKSEL